MELGNLMFGNSRGEFKFPSRELAYSDEWRLLLEILDMSESGFTQYVALRQEHGGVDTERFSIAPYYYGDCNCNGEHVEGCPCMRHNFVYKPTGFAIDWYKYPFRDSYMNQNLSKKEIQVIWTYCYNWMLERIDDYADDAHVFVLCDCDGDVIASSKKYTILNEERECLMKDGWFAYPQEILSIHRVQLLENRG